MRYSVVDFLVSPLLQWIFSEKHPLENVEYAPGTFVQLLMNAAQAKDYVETISSLDHGLTNVDTLFGDYPRVQAGIGHCVNTKKL